MSIGRFEANAERYLAELARALQEGSYQPAPVRRVHIPKGKGQTRPLGIATVKDRVVQAALKLVVEPIFEKEFLPVSFGFRPGRSGKDALRVVDQALKESYTWVVDADLQSYFDTIPKQPLLALVREKISDGKVLDLFERFLEQDVMDGRKRWTPIAGTLQGSVISPLMSNLYLHGLDVLLSEAGHKYARFADDCAPRRRTGGRKPSVQPCCTRDEVGPLEAAVQAEASNHPLLLPSREVVVRELGKGRGRPGQVRTVESNASEPLMRCRKRRNDVKTGGESLPRDQSGGNLFTARAASGMKAARTRSRLLCGTWEPCHPDAKGGTQGEAPRACEYRSGVQGRSNL